MLRDLGVLQSKMLNAAIPNVAASINPSLFPKTPPCLLSDKYPTIGSLNPSQNAEIATAIPTSVPDTPRMLVPKNIIKLDMVCEIVPYPRLPIP